MMYTMDPSEPHKPQQLVNFKLRGARTYPLLFYTTNKLSELIQCFYQSNTYVGCISHHDKKPRPMIT